METQQAARSARIVIAVVIGSSTFFLNYVIAREFDDNRAFEQINVLFEADSSWYLGGFFWGGSLGSPHGGRSRVHPNITNFVNPPVRIAAASVCAVTGCNEKKVRRQLSLAVTPVFGGIAASLCFLIALGLNAPTRWAIVFAGLSAVSFSSLFFGSVAESYMLSGAGYAALFYLLVLTIANGRPPQFLPWLAVGMFLIGTTVTNVGPFALAALAAQYWRRSNIKSAVISSGNWTLAAVAASAVFCVAVSSIYGELSAMAESVRQLDELSLRIGERLAVFPFALSNTFLPPMPNVIDIISVTKTPYSFQFSFEGQRAWSHFIVIVALIGWSALTLRWQDRATRYLFGTAATVIAYNWALHLFFGDELFLYSQHWQMAMMMILAGLLRPDPKFGTAGRWSMLVLLLYSIWNDMKILNFVMPYLTENVIT
jgi:hypothetical protein